MWWLKTTTASAGRRDGQDIGVEPVSHPARRLPSPPATPHLHQNLPRPVADRQLRLRSDPHRRIMVAAHPPFGVFVGNEGIPAVAQTRLRPQLPSPLAVLLGDLIRVERPGVEVDPAAGRDAATVAFIRIERAVRPSRADGRSSRSAPRGCRAPPSGWPPASQAVRRSGGRNPRRDPPGRRGRGRPKGSRPAAGTAPSPPI